MLFTMLLLFWLPLSGQQVLLGEDLRGDTLVPDFGMNRKHYTHSYFGFHFVAGQAEDQAANVALGRSWSFEYGFRYKRRYNQTFSGGFELLAKRSSFHPERFLEVEIPEDYSYNREKFVFLSMGGVVYQRFNYGMRGNYIGRFVDIGAYGDMHMNVRHILRLDGDPRLRIRRAGMDYHEFLGYGVFLRLGFNNFVLRGTYRLSDIFKPEAGLAGFPRISFGLELGLHPL
jgi:hypothetical protein